MIATDGDGEHLVEDDGGGFVEVEDVELVVVGAVGRLADASVARVGPHVDTHHGVDVQPGQLLRLDYRHAHLHHMPKHAASCCIKR